MGIQINGQTDTISAFDNNFSLAGNVSIGGTLTYEDVTSVDAVGLSTFQAGIQLDDSITHLGDTNTKIRFPAADTVAVETAGAERVRITSAGLVGVNCTPLSQLQVKTATNANIALTADGSEASIEAFNDAGSANVPLRIRGSEIKFKIDGTQRARLYYSSSSAVLSLGDESNSAGHLRFEAKASENQIHGRSNHPITFLINTAERLRITSTGKIGIGVASPDEMMEITNTAGTGCQIQLRDTSTGSADARGFRVGYNGSGGQLWNFENTYIRFATNNTERLRIASDGQIGMGKAGAVTVNGNSPLTIQESDSNSETICLRATNSGGNGSQPGIVMKTAAGGHIGGIYCDVNSDYMRLSTSGTDRMIITNTGSVGVNIASPTGNFEVNGNDGINISNATRTGTNGAQWRLIPHNGGGSATNLRLYEGVGATEVINITKTGRIIIGGYDDFVRGNLQVVDGGGGELNLGRFDTTVSQYNDIGHIFFSGNAGSSGHAIGGISCYAAQNQTATSKPSYLTFTTCDASNPPTLVERLRITENGTLVHYGGHKNNSGGSNLGSGTYYRINASVTVPQNSTKTLTFTGLATGWMTIRIGGYGNAGSQAINCMYELGGYMTATYTYDVHTVRQWARTGSISTGKNASNFTVTLPGGGNVSGCVTWITVEGNNASIAVNSN